MIPKHSTPFRGSNYSNTVHLLPSSIFIEQCCVNLNLRTMGCLGRRILEFHLTLVKTFMARLTVVLVFLWNWH